MFISVLCHIIVIALSHICDVYDLSSEIILYIIKEGKMSQNTLNSNKNKREFGVGTFIFLALLIAANVAMCHAMGTGIFFSVLLKTAYATLMDTVLYICAVCVLMGALSALLSEFGVVAFLEWLLSPIMRPIYGLPGAASLGIVTSFLSDNAAVLGMYGDPGCIKYFKKNESSALVNLGTTFGMATIVLSFMVGLGTKFVSAIGCGLIGVFVGSIVSVRLYLHFSNKSYKKEGRWEEMNQYHVPKAVEEVAEDGKPKKKKGVGERFLNAILEGGSLGWKVTVQSTPGVVVICTVIMMLTFGPAGDHGEYLGQAYEGIALMPKIGELISPVTDILFGFKSGEAISFVVTSLGAVGAAIGLVPQMIEQGAVGPNEIAVFVAMGITWSGFTTTHVGMLDVVEAPDRVGIAIWTHLVAGFIAGIVGHLAFVLIC